MKIVLIHYRYFPESGPESYLFNVKKLLEKKGHQVIPFSLDYKKNTYTKFNHYFPKPIGSSRNFHYSKQKNIALNKKISIVKNAYFNKNVYKSLQKLINEQKPDIAYILQFWGKLSPSVIQSCYDNKIPILLRLSDYGLICSKNIFYRKKSVCTKCIDSQINSIFYKCVDNSFAKSIINYFLFLTFYLFKYQKKIDGIIVPSKKMSLIFKKYKFYRNTKIFEIPTFVPINQLKKNKNLDISSKKYDFFYSGRLASDKGVHIILDALLLLSKKNKYPRMIIVGGVKNEYAQNLIKISKKNKLNIKFSGYLEKEKLLSKLQESLCSIVPSLWFDNMPNSLIEAQSKGVPSIVSDIGSLPELIKNNYNGLLFETGNANDLSEKILSILKMEPKKFEIMTKNATTWANNYCNENTHYNKLIKTFNDTIENHKQ